MLEVGISTLGQTGNGNDSCTNWNGDNNFRTSGLRMGEKGNGRNKDYMKFYQIQLFSGREKQFSKGGIFLPDHMRALHVGSSQTNGVFSG